MSSLSNLPNKIHIINLPELLVLPRMVCNIKVFDPHVQKIILESFSNDRIIGLANTRYEQFSSKKVFENIGVACKIRSFKEDTLNNEVFFELTIEGVSRFKVIDWILNEDNKVLKALVLWKKFEIDLEALPPSKVNPHAVIKGLNRYLMDREQEINIKQFSDISDQLLVDSIAMALHFTPEQRQFLLEAVDFNDRAVLLMDIFYMDHPVPQGYDEGLGLVI